MKKTRKKRCFLKTAPPYNNGEGVKHDNLLPECNPLWVRQLLRNAHTLDYEVSSSTHWQPKGEKMLCNLVFMHAYARKYTHGYTHGSTRVHTHTREGKS